MEPPLNLLVSSSIDITGYHAVNLELIHFTSANIMLAMPACKHIEQLAKSTECLFAPSSILQQEKESFQEVVSARKNQASGK